MAIEVTNTMNAVHGNGFNALVIGPSGSGKTSIFKYTGKTIIISSEGSELTLNDNDVDVIKIKSSVELKEAYEYVSQHKDEYDCVGIDSFTDMSEMINAELKADPYYGDAKNSIVMWGKQAEISSKIAKAFRDLNGINVIILALPETVKVGFDETIVAMMPGKKTQSIISSYYDIVMLIKVDEDGNRYFVTGMTEDFSGKDRSDKLSPVEPYTKEDGIRPLFDKVLGR